MNLKRPYERGVKKLTSAESKFHSPIAGRKHAERMKLCIEGEYIDALGIAARLGLHRDTVDRRLKHLRKQPGPITWAALKESVPREKP